MKVILAQPRDFCAGVVHAIDIVERALDKYGAPSYVRHEIVHNGTVVEALEANVYLVQSEEVAALELAAGTPLAYVTPTTLSLDATKSIVAALGSLELTLLPGVEEDIEFRLPSELVDA
jgi:4-hydroxy-3-methylbut-2-enyl diphosphate reductase IspH